MVRFASLPEWRDRSVEGAFESCLSVARCGKSLTTDESRIMCAVAAFNAFDVKPNRGMVRSVSEVPKSRFYNVIGGLENSGAVECIGRGASAECDFGGCPSFKSSLADRKGIRVTRRGKRVWHEVPEGSEDLFRHLTGVERQNLLDMVDERAPESWDVAAVLDYVDPSLSYSENKEILDDLLPSGVKGEVEEYERYLAMEEEMD